MAELKLTDQNTKEFEKVLQGEMDKVVKHFERDLLTIRTGRAHPSLIEDIKVTVYGGTAMRLKEISSITSPEPRLLVVQPWDAGVINDIEKALTNSDLGLSPANDGAYIRITLPEMSTQRRDELAKILGKKTEDNRISIRNVRKNFHNLIRDAQKDKDISEDHGRRLSDILQKITDMFIDKINDMSSKKEKEIKTV
jgi:ribosome recycling factor